MRGRNRLCDRAVGELANTGWLFSQTLPKHARDLPDVVGADDRACRAPRPDVHEQRPGRRETLRDGVMVDYSANACHVVFPHGIGQLLGHECQWTLFGLIVVDQYLHTSPLKKNQTAHEPSNQSRTIEPITNHRTSHESVTNQSRTRPLTNHQTSLNQARTIEPVTNHQTSHEPSQSSRTSHEPVTVRSGRQDTLTIPTPGVSGSDATAPGTCDTAASASAPSPRTTADGTPAAITGAAGGVTAAVTEAATAAAYHSGYHKHST